MTTRPEGFSSSSDFDPNHMTAVILHLLQRTKSIEPNKLYALIYDADRNHLGKYGRLITGDIYYAFSTGSTPIRVHHALSSILSESNPHESPLAHNLRSSLRITSDGQVEAAGQPDLDELSDSEIECLDAAQPLNQDSAWNSSYPNAPITTWAIARTLPNWQQITAHLLDPFPG